MIEEHKPVSSREQHPKVVDSAACEATARNGDKRPSNHSLTPDNLKPLKDSLGLDKGLDASATLQARSPGFHLGVILECNRYTESQIQACIALLKERLGSTEVGSYRHLQMLLERNPDARKSTYIIVAITDDTGNMAAVASGTVTPTGLFIVGYTVSAARYEGLGLGTQAYKSLAVAARQTCKSQFDNDLKLLIVEASHGAENYWRRQGFGETVLTDQLGLRKKLAYLQPPLRWIRESGEPANAHLYPDSREVSLGKECVRFPGVHEELMMKIVGEDNSQTISKDTVLNAIETLYREYYFLEQAVDPAAHPRYFAYFAALMKSYEAELSSATEITLA